MSVLRVNIRLCLMQKRQYVCEQVTVAIPPASVWSNCVVYRFSGKARLSTCEILYHVILVHDAYDIKAKTNVFISQVNTLNNKFSGVTCNVRGKLLQSYCCAWYGCKTWDLHTKMAQ